MNAAVDALERQTVAGHEAIRAELAEDREQRLKQQIVTSDAARQDFLRYVVGPVALSLIALIGTAVFGIHP